MREADVVAKIHEAFKKQLPRAVWLKYNDLSTTGIPDLAVTYAGRTTFVEVKLLRTKETPSSFKKHLPSLQLATCRLLEGQGRCLYFLAYGDAFAVTVRPQRLAYFLEKGGAEISGLLRPEEFGITLNQEIDNLVARVRNAS